MKDSRCPSKGLSFRITLGIVSPPPASYVRNIFATQDLEAPASCGVSVCTNQRAANLKAVTENGTLEPFILESQQYVFHYISQEEIISKAFGEPWEVKSGKPST